MSEQTGSSANNEAGKKRDWITLLIPEVVPTLALSFALFASIIAYRTWTTQADNRKGEIAMTPDLDVSLGMTRTNYGPNEPRTYNGLIKFTNDSLRKMKIKGIQMTIYSCVPSDNVIARVNRHAELERLRGLRDYYVAEKVRLATTAETVKRTGNTQPIEVAAFLDVPELEKGFRLDITGQYQGYIAQTVFVSSDTPEKTRVYVERCDKRVSEISSEIESLSQEKSAAFVVISDQVGDYEFERIRTIEFGQESDLSPGERLDRSFQLVEVPQKTEEFQASYFYRLDIAIEKDGASAPESIIAECFTTDGNTEVSCSLIAN